MALPFEVKLELKKGVNKMVAAISIPLKIAGKALSKKSLKKLGKQTAAEEAAMKQAEAVQKAFREAEAKYPMSGLKEGGLVIKDRQYLKGK